MIDKTNNDEFDYGKGVKVKISAPKKFHPGQVGTICGMDRVTDFSEAQEYSCNVGDWIYTVELPNGFSIEVAGCYLEIDPNRLKYKMNELVYIRNDFQNEKTANDIVSIIDFHKINGESLANRFDLKLGDYIYVIENQSGGISLIPESFIEKKVNIQK